MKKIKEIMKSLNANPRLKAIFKLGLWLIFFGVLFIVVYILSMFMPNNNTDKPDNIIDIVKIMENVAVSNYEYEYNIKLGDAKTKIVGTKYQSINRFYKEENSSIVKYQVEDDNAYQIVGDYYEPITIDIYGDIDESLINLKSVAALFNGKPYQYNSKSDEYQVNIDGKLITVLNAHNNLKVSIKFEDNNYELKYYNFNRVEEIKRISD